MSAKPPVNFSDVGGNTFDADTVDNHLGEDLLIKECSFPPKTVAGGLDGTLLVVDCKHGKGTRIITFSKVVFEQARGPKFQGSLREGTPIKARLEREKRYIKLV